MNGNRVSCRLCAARIRMGAATLDPCISFLMRLRGEHLGCHGVGSLWIHIWIRGCSWLDPSTCGCIPQVLISVCQVTAFTKSLFVLSVHCWLFGSAHSKPSVWTQRLSLKASRCSLVLLYSAVSIQGCYLLLLLWLHFCQTHFLPSTPSDLSELLQRTIGACSFALPVISADHMSRATGSVYGDDESELQQEFC